MKTNSYKKLEIDSLYQEWTETLTLLRSGPIGPARNWYLEDLQELHSKAQQLLTDYESSSLDLTKLRLMTSRSVLDWERWHKAETQPRI